jgi:16S rRNA (cytidine1402-2'-O)-methyltransferase
LIFYEAPHRIREVLADARDALGERQAVVARELTKVHEQFVRGRLSEIELPEGAARGEIVLMVGPPLIGKPEQPEGDQTHSILERVEELMRSEALDQKNALKRVARERGISKSEAYRLMIAERARSKRI